VNHSIEPGLDVDRAARPARGGLLQRASAAVRRRFQRDSAGLDRGTLLERVIADLENLNRRTERDFLTIGGKLAEFLAAARRISADMSALGGVIFGKDGGHASQVLSRVLEQSKQAEARAEAGDRALAGVCDSTRQIGLTFRG